MIDCMLILDFSPALTCSGFGEIESLSEYWEFQDHWNQKLAKGGLL